LPRTLIEILENRLKSFNLSLEKNMVAICNGGACVMVIMGKLLNAKLGIGDLKI
jgi:hypothetical protein